MGNWYRNTVSNWVLLFENKLPNSLTHLSMNLASLSLIRLFKEAILASAPCDSAAKSDFQATGTDLNSWWSLIIDFLNDKQNIVGLAVRHQQCTVWCLDPWNSRTFAGEMCQGTEPQTDGSPSLWWTDLEELTPAAQKRKTKMLLVNTNKWNIVILTLLTLTHLYCGRSGSSGLDDTMPYLSPRITTIRWQRHTSDRHSCVARPDSSSVTPHRSSTSCR